MVEETDEDVFGETELAIKRQDKMAVVLVTLPEVQKLSDQYIGTVIAGLHEKANIAKAEEGLAKCVTLRNQIEKVRKALKEPVLEEGRNIDAAAKVLQSHLAPTETRLEHELDKVKKAQAKIDKENEDKLWDKRYGEMQSVSLDFPEATIRKMPEDEFRKMINTAIERMEEQQRIDDAARLRQKELDAQAETQRIQQEEIDRQRAENDRIHRERDQKAEDDRKARQKIIDDQMESMRKQQAAIDAAAEKVRLDREEADRQERERIAAAARAARATKYAERISILRLINPECDVDPDWLVDLTDEYMVVAENAQRDIVKKAEADAKAEADRIEAMRPEAEKILAFANEIRKLILGCNVSDAGLYERISLSVSYCATRIEQIAGEITGPSVATAHSDDTVEYF